MRLNILAVSLLLAGVNAQTQVDGCPKGNYDCLDVINSSQCLEQLIIEKNAPLNTTNMARCVEFYDSVTNNTGAYKLCQCPGCHSAPINAAIVQMFPAPCGTA